MEQIHNFSEYEAHEPEFYESETTDDVRCTLKLASGGHTFVFKLDAAANTCELERSYSLDGDEVNPDDLTRLQPAAEKRAYDRLSKLTSDLGELFA